PTATSTSAGIPASTTNTPTPQPIVAVGPPPAPPERRATVAQVAPLQRRPYAPSTSLVIRQIYGGGGNVGAPYRNDFIEIYTLGGAPVSVDGWSVQHAAATGTTWQATLLSGTVAPGGYLVVPQDS